MNVAIGAATQWLFNFIIARSMLDNDNARNMIADLSPAVLTMSSTMGNAGYVRAQFPGFQPNTQTPY